MVEGGENQQAAAAVEGEGGEKKELSKSQRKRLAKKIQKAKTRQLLGEENADVAPNAEVQQAAQEALEAINAADGTPAKKKKKKKNNRKKKKAPQGMVGE